jgi:hypothetical protein
MSEPAIIDLKNIAGQLALTEPFDDFDGILHKQALDASAANTLRNIHFVISSGAYAGRFYVAGKVRYFAYVPAKRLGDLARFMDVVYAQLRPLRQRKQKGVLNDNDLNFTTAQMEADVRYFFEKRKDVWDIISQITSAVKRGLGDRPTNTKEANQTNMQRYQEMIATTRRLMQADHDTILAGVNELSRKFDYQNRQLAALLSAHGVTLKEI